MWCNADAVVTAVKRHEIRLEEDIAVDLRRGRGRLEATEACRAGLVDRRKVDIIAAYRGHERAADVDRQVGQGGAAGEGHTADGVVVYRALDLTVVRVHHARVYQHECGSRVGDGLAAGDVGRRAASADSKRLRRELPEARGGVDVGPVQRAGEFGVVDGAEFVRSGGGVAEVGSEDGFRQGCDGIVKEGLLLLWLDGVELAECQPDESIGGGVLDEGLGDSCGEFYGLGRH